jgi:NAD(P)-dependent dehydrogenase (short-subunit alcohol dehydrogenase family)
MNWTGRVAVVTGSASGIGEATAREFAAEGVYVGILDINVEAGEKVAAQLREQGLVAEFHLLDVSDRESCGRVVDDIAAKWGRVDYLVNSAVSFIGKGLDATPTDWDRSLGVNIQGAANMAQACYPHMKAAGGGAIVNIASISAHIAQPNRWTYNATKGGIVTMTKCQALDLAPDNIRANVVSPGWTWTPEVAKAANGDRAKWEPIWGSYSMMRRFGEPREIGRAILFLCSDDASFITGTELAVDGGYMALGSEGLGNLSEYAGTA